ncbi:MAG: hypothetical protein CMJ23_08925 [Phycisphaerae bacterium]|nr:hypothetical protein [Phycisphaerae bacterium]
MWIAPAILTVSTWFACGSTTGVPGTNRTLIDPPTEVSVSDSNQISPIPALERGFSFRVRPSTGENEAAASWPPAGPWRGFDQLGVLTGSAVVPWGEIASADRLRVGREILQRTGRDRDPASMAFLAVALAVVENDDISRRAIEEAIRLAGDEGASIRSAIETEIETRTQARAARARENEAATLQAGRPHLAYDDQSPFKPIDPFLIPTTLRQQRESVEQAVAGLGLSVVPTDWTLSVGHGGLEAVSRHGVRMDRYLADCRTRLGFSADVRPFPGALVLIRVPDFDDARLIVADLFRHQWSNGDPSLMFPTSAGPWVFLPPPDSENPAGGPRSAEFEEARIAGRAVILTAHGGRRLPGWMVEGFAEASAAFLVDPSSVEDALRPEAVAMIRAGRSPGWINSVSDDDASWGPGGAARGLALILVTRLLESGDDVFPGIVAGLKAGESVDKVFRRWTGLTLQQWFDDSAAWFRFND